MLSMQHIMCDTLASDKLSDRQNVAALVYPDAIRGYGVPREVTHFETNASEDDVSYWSFPTDMMMYSDANLINNHCDKFGHTANNIAKCAIGERSDINAFYEHNQHLPKKMYDGIETHLKQDIVFDDFIRTHIDCTDKYRDIFVVTENGEERTVDGKELRSIIGAIEQQGIYVLAHEIYEKTGETVNKEWFTENVYPVLQKEYPADLADKTFGFMNIDEHIDELITNHDWSELDKSVYDITYDDFKSLYEDVSAYASGIDYNFLPSKMSDVQRDRVLSADTLVSDVESDDITITKDL